MQQPDNRSNANLVATGRRLKKLAVGVIVILAIGFVLVFGLRLTHEHMIASATRETALAPPIVNVVTVQASPATIGLTLPGETAAWFESVIYARVDGYVGSWSADIGDHVTKGQVLAKIQTPDLDAQLVAAKAKLNVAEAQVEFTKSTYERWKNSPQGVVSEQEREAKKADYDSAVAQRGIDQADVDRYTALTAFKLVTAPYDGIITQRQIDVGNLVTAGSTASTTSLYKIVQDDPIRVFIDVPQSVAGSIKADIAAQITANDLPGHVFEGKVARTADAINEQTRTLHVEVDIPNPNHTLMTGTYVDVAFEVPSKGLLQIPAAALVFQPSGPHIAIIGSDNKIDFRAVTIARDNGSTVEIASGIAAGDRVALNIGNQVTQGETVDAQEESDAGDHAKK